jgi:hypothetical protein
MAKKTLDEMLGESTMAPDAKRSARRRAVFLEYWGEMQEAHRNGWTWNQIHAALFREGIVDYPYPTFMYYKDRRVRQKPTEAKWDPGAPNTTATKTGTPGHSSRPFVSTKGELPAFKDVTREREDKWF